MGKASNNLNHLSAITIVLSKWPAAFIVYTSTLQQECTTTTEIIHLIKEYVT